MAGNRIYVERAECEMKIHGGEELEQTGFVQMRIRAHDLSVHVEEVQEIKLLFVFCKANPNWPETVDAMGHRGILRAIYPSLKGITLGRRQT